MKIKKDNGASLTGFVITILVILLIVAVAGCVYLINNPIKEKVAIQTPTNIENLNSSDKVETSKKNNELETNNSEELDNITKTALEEYVSKFYYVKNFDEITKQNIDSLMCVAILDEPSRSLVWDGEKLGLAKQDILKQLVAEKVKCSASTLPNSENFAEGDSLSGAGYITQWPFEDGDAEQFVGYIAEVDKVKDVGNNKFEITVLQVAYNLAIGVEAEEGNLQMYLSADQSQKSVVSKIAKNDMNSYKANTGEKCVRLVKEFAKNNNVGYRTFTVEMLENNNNSYYGNFKLISIK